MDKVRLLKHSLVLNSPAMHLSEGGLRSPKLCEYWRSFSLGPTVDISVIHSVRILQIEHEIRLEMPK